jgi:hypothetical protein
MAKKDRHSQLLKKEAGKTGRIEIPLPSGSRLDVLTRRGIGTEIELNSDPEKLRMAASRLKEAIDTEIAKKGVLKVPQPAMANAAEAMRAEKVQGIVSNLKGSKTLPVSKSQASSKR